MLYMKRLISLAILLAVAAAAMPQSRPGRTLYSGMMLKNPSIQNELKLTPAQRKQVKDYMPGMYRMAPGKAPSAPKNAAEMQKQFRESMAKYEADERKILATLTPAQKARLKQISLQMHGISAVGIPEVAKEVGLTADQVAKVRAIEQTEMTAMRKLYPTPKAITSRMSPEDARKRSEEMMERMRKMQPQITAIRKNTEAQTMAILTPAQKQKWQKLLGAKWQRPVMRMGGVRGK
jgi:Spy/CpxP family protein refolding chaperone